MTEKIHTAIGLMSGTSLDGVDAAIVRTDGNSVQSFGQSLFLPYREKFKENLRKVLALAPVMAGKPKSEIGPLFRSVERELTKLHADAVRQLLRKESLSKKNIAVIGFHGQTIYHAPEKSITWQLGDGALLAQLTGLNVINDFRSNDVRSGGQGAPFAPLYHMAVVRERTSCKTLAVLNIGGVANLTWISFKGRRPRLLAFDTGPGNALVNDWVFEGSGRHFDEDGMLARAGKVQPFPLQEALKDPYFTAPPPKSLDRNYFSAKMVEGMSLEDGAATLTAFTVACVAKASRLCPAPPEAWYITGGGRHNAQMMKGLKKVFGVPVEPVEVLGLRGDSLEAEAFAFLAVRSANGWPLSLPETTGVKEMVSGGRLYRA